MISESILVIASFVMISGTLYLYVCMCVHACMSKHVVTTLLIVCVQKTRKREGIECPDLRDPAVKQELLTQKFSVLVSSFQVHGVPEGSSGD